MLGKSMLAVVGSGGLFAAFIVLLASIGPLAPKVLITSAAIAAFAGAI